MASKNKAALFFLTRFGSTKISAGLPFELIKGGSFFRQNRGFYRRLRGISPVLVIILRVKAMKMQVGFKFFSYIWACAWASRSFLGRLNPFAQP
jgi:hypothetical protein